MIPAVASIAFRNTPLYIEEILPKAAAAGYKQLEIWGGHIEKRDDNEMPVIAELAERNGLSLPIVSCYLGTFSLKKSMSDLDAQMKLAHFATEMASLLGAKYLRAFAGFTMECSSRDASQDYWKFCIDGLRDIAAIAARKNLVLAVETHKLTLADTVNGCLRIIEEAAAPNIKLILQLDGPAETENKSPVEVWNALKQHVVHMHQKPETAPFPARVLRELFSKMHDDGYKGAITIEAANPDVQPGPVLKRGMELLHSLGVINKGDDLERKR